jgi:hypothetical protein
MDRKEGYKTEQGEETDGRKGQGKDGSRGGGAANPSQATPHARRTPGVPPHTWWGRGVSDTGCGQWREGRRAAKNTANHPADSRY